MRVSSNALSLKVQGATLRPRSRTCATIESDHFGPSQLVVPDLATVVARGDPLVNLGSWLEVEALLGASLLGHWFCWMLESGTGWSRLLRNRPKRDTARSPNCASTISQSAMTEPAKKAPVIATPTPEQARARGRRGPKRSVPRWDTGAFRFLGALPAAADGATVWRSPLLPPSQRRTPRPSRTGRNSRRRRWTTSRPDTRTLWWAWGVRAACEEAPAAGYQYV